MLVPNYTDVNGKNIVLQKCEFFLDIFPRCGIIALSKEGKGMTREQRKFMNVWDKVRAKYDEWLEDGCNLSKAVKKATDCYFELYTGKNWKKKTKTEQYARVFHFLFDDMHCAASCAGMDFEIEPVKIDLKY